MRKCALVVSCLSALAQGQEEGGNLRRRDLDGNPVRWSSGGAVADEATITEEAANYGRGVDYGEELLIRTGEYWNGKGENWNGYGSKGSKSSKSSKGDDDCDEYEMGKGSKSSKGCPHPTPAPYHMPKPSYGPSPPQCGMPGLGSCPSSGQCTCKCVPDVFTPHPTYKPTPHPTKKPSYHPTPAPTPKKCYIDPDYPMKVHPGDGWTPEMGYHIGDLCAYRVYADGINAYTDTHPIKVCCDVPGDNGTPDPDCVGCDQCETHQTVNDACCAWAFYPDGPREDVARDGYYEGGCHEKGQDCCFCGQDEYHCITAGTSCAEYCKMTPAPTPAPTPQPTEKTVYVPAVEPTSSPVEPTSHPVPASLAAEPTSRPIEPTSSPVDEPTSSPLSACAAHPVCVEKNLSGNCCPNVSGLMLDCCL